MAVIEELRNGKAVNERQTGAGISGREHRLSVDHQAREIEKLIRQTADLREGLIGLAKNLRISYAVFCLKKKTLKQLLLHVNGTSMTLTRKMAISELLIIL